MRTYLWLLLALAVFTLLWRVVPHPLNMTPLAALALFAGARARDPRLRFAIPMGALLISDLLLGFHSTVPFVYAAMLLIVVLGTLLRGKSLPYFALGSVAGSVSFYLITNFGVWAAAGYYTPDVSGLIASYVAGLPFLLKTLAGDFFFVVMFFALFAFADSHVAQREAGVNAR